MERVVIHELYRYKLVLGQEREVNAVSANKEKLAQDAGKGTKLVGVYYQDFVNGWKPVLNVQKVFDIAGAFRYKVSKKLLQELNPSEAFLAALRKAREAEKPSKQKRKRNKKGNKS